MATYYFVGLRATDDDQIQVYLDRRDGSRGQGMPMGTFKNAEQAGTAAAFLQDALHDRYMDGMSEAYDRAMKTISEQSGD